MQTQVGVYMRPGIKICSTMTKNLFTLLFTASKMKWNFVAGVVGVKRLIKKCK